MKLKSIKLNNEQLLWLENVRENGGRSSGIEVSKALFGKISRDFNSKKSLEHLWDGNRITLFGIYKLDSNSKELIALDKMVRALRDGLAFQSGKNFISTLQFSEACKLPRSLVLELLSGGLFFDYWIDNNDTDRVSFTGEGEWQYELSEGAIRRLAAYKDLETQIELRWQIATSRIGGLHAVESREALAAGIVESFEPGPSNPDKAPRSEKLKGLLIGITPDLGFGIWKGERYSINSNQAKALKACIELWKENGRRPIALKIEDVRRRADDPNLETIGRTFIGHPLKALFTFKGGKGVFVFGP